MEQTQQTTKPKRALLNGERVLWVIIAMLSIVSVLLVFSSTAKMAYDISSVSSPLRFLITQLGFLGISIIIMILFHRVSVNLYGAVSWYIWGGCAVLTFLTLIFGSSVNGAARWLNLGFIHVQPSEFLKVAIVLHLAKMLSKEGVKAQNIKLFPSYKDWGKAKNKKIWREGTLPIVVPIFGSIGAIVMAHTSSAILVFVVSLVILYIAGIHWKEIIKLAAVVIAIGALFYAFGMGRSDTAEGRMETWFATWFSDRTEVRVDYISDTERSMVAMQNGGLLGQGAGQSSMRVEMIHPESDYAFAFFVEEYGLILSLFLLFLYLWIFFRSIWIYERCRDGFKRLLVLSLATLILVQALLHVMVAVNFLPETGQTLPLISRGGSALFCTYMAFMLMLSISAKYEES